MRSSPIFEMGQKPTTNKQTPRERGTPNKHILILDSSVLRFFTFGKSASSPDWVRAFSAWDDGSDHLHFTQAEKCAAFRVSSNEGV